MMIDDGEYRLKLGNFGAMLPIAIQNRSNAIILLNQESTHAMDGP
jgi:hypothetical protein